MEKNSEIFNGLFDKVRQESQITATGLDILLTEGLKDAQGDLKEIGICERLLYIFPQDPREDIGVLTAEEAQ